MGRIGGCSSSATSGRYAGRKMAEHIKAATVPEIDRRQVEADKERAYARVKGSGEIGWKEIHAGTARIIQDYCGEYKSEEILKTGLRWLDSIRESEAANACARNPHELMRVLECMSRITVGEMIMHASLASEASSRPLGFNRMDFPEMDPSDWNKFITTGLENNEIKTGELLFNYWLLPPYASTYKENYEKYCTL